MYPGVRHLSACSSDTALSWHELSGSAELLQDAPTVQWCRVPKPWKMKATEGDGAIMLRANGLVQSQVLSAAAAFVQSATMDRDPDSVDGLPTYELRWVRQGRYTHRALEAIFRDTIEQRVVPLLRRSPLHRGTDLVLCEALVRCYAEGQRRTHPPHYDADALVTAVFELDMTRPLAAAVAPAVSFEGGFYVQPGAHRRERMPIRMHPGDLVAHSFDLQHGVEVTSGERCSVVLWFTDSHNSCADKSRPWYARAAAGGDADAQYNRAKELMYDDPRASLSLMQAAAEQGHFMAQNDLGAMLLEGRGCADAVPKLDEAERWFSASASQGFQRAMVSLAVVCSRRGDEAAALAWLHRAAEQEEPEVLFRLGRIYAHGWLSAEKDQACAQRWLRAAAQRGHPGAMLDLGRALSQSAPTEAEQWLRQATDQGLPGAAVWLMGHHVRMGQPLSMLAVLSEAIRRLGRVSSKWDWRG